MDGGLNQVSAREVKATRIYEKECAKDFYGKKVSRETLCIGALGLTPLRLVGPRGPVPMGFLRTPNT